jgi:hypothetical protein
MTHTQASQMKGQKGQALIMAIVLSLGVSVVVGTLLDQSLSTDKMLKGARIRAAMMAAEQRLKLLSVTPSSFVCSSTTSPSGPVNECTLVSFPAAELNHYLPQVRCPNSAPCGVEIRNLALNNGHMTARIEYTGSDLSFQGTNVDIEVPKDILQSSQSDCFSIDPSKPVFAGFRSDGSPDCRALSGNCTGPGEYVSAVDSKTLKVTCSTFQNNVGCRPDQFMTSLRWTGSAFTATCANRPDPFTKFAFTPAPASAPVTAVSEAPGPMPRKTCAPTTTTTTTTTTTSPPPSPGPTPSPSASPFVCDDPAGPGVWSCNHPDNGVAYVGNSCNLSRTGDPCCPVWSPIPAWQYGRGGNLPAGPGVEEIHIKCASKAYCEMWPDRCMIRW